MSNIIFSGVYTSGPPLKERVGQERRGIDGRIEGMRGGEGRISSSPSANPPLYISRMQAVRVPSY